MKRIEMMLLKIVIWYVIFMVIVTASYSGYRRRFGDPKYFLVEPEYEVMPEWSVFFVPIKASVDTPKPQQPYFIGDSVAYIVKDYPKAVFPGKKAHAIAQRVNEIPQVDYSFDIILMAGMADLRSGAQKRQIDRGLKEIQEALHARFPKCSITIIHPTEIYKICMTHGLDRYHMNEKGFAILTSRYPVCSHLNNRGGVEPVINSYPSAEP